MAYPSSEGLFILDTDASDHSVGAVLSQVQGNYERVIAYGSHALNKAERNYCVTDRELLAVKHFVEYYRQYLLGRKFLIRTDHQALRWLFSLREPKARIARWIEILSAFHFEIEYRPGQKHGNADALSRCPEPQQCRCSMEVPDLKCGPCSKCRKKSAVMQSSWKELHGDEIGSAAGQRNPESHGFGLALGSFVQLDLWLGWYDSAMGLGQTWKFAILLWMTRWAILQISNQNLSAKQRVPSIQPRFYVPVVIQHENTQIIAALWQRLSSDSEMETVRETAIWSSCLSLQSSNSALLEPVGHTRGKGWHFVSSIHKTRLFRVLHPVPRTC